MTVQQLIDTLQASGWRLTKSENDIRHFKHASHQMPVTLSGRLDLLVPPGILKVIRRSTQLEENNDGYAVIFEKCESSFGAYVPDLPGCMAVGESLAEAKTLIAQAMKQHLDSLKMDGQRPPEPTCIAAYIDA